MLPISKALGRITPIVMLPFDNPFYKRSRQALFEINKTFKFYEETDFHIASHLRKERVRHGKPST